MEQQKKKDFFISYNRADEEKAVWINCILKLNGYATVIQAEDFGPGNNFVLAMQKAATEATRTIAVLSPDYLQSKFTAPEWAAAFVQDPTGEQRTLIPVKVRPVELMGLLKSIVYIDLLDIDEEEAETRLLSKIQDIAGRPRPVFKKSESSTASKIAPQYLSNQAEQKLGQINRKKHRDHLAIQIWQNENRKTHGFVISGEQQECPEDIRFKLSYLLQEDLINHNPKPPEILGLRTEKSYRIGKSAEQFLWELLAKRLGSCNPEKAAIEMRLNQVDRSYLFFRELPSDESDNQQFLVDLLVAWSNLSLASTSHSHFLLLIHAAENSGNSLFRWPFLAKRKPSWRDQIESLLKQHEVIGALLPEFHPPSKKEIRDWKGLHIEESVLRDGIEELLTGQFLKHESIPLGKFKKAALPLLKKHYSQ
ncbi:MAG: hypothetical protein A4S08_08710 [Proteobacteria bacterium SG_bin4]|nr:MAG: hypothetical protein A4S08_08710 [Proteobacteria bacterium SG_bin4]